MLIQHLTRVIRNAGKAGVRDRTKAERVRAWGGKDESKAAELFLFRTTLRLRKGLLQLSRPV